MTIGIGTSLRDSRLALIKDAIDAGSAESKLQIYSGSRPTTGEEVDEYTNSLLVEFELPYPCGTVSEGVLTFDSISGVSAIASGTAVWARLLDADEDFVADMSVSDMTGSGDVKIDSVELVIGDSISCTLATITEGNS